MYKLIPLFFFVAFMGLSAPAASSFTSAPALAGKAGGGKYRLPHKLKHDKAPDKSAKLA